MNTVLKTLTAATLLLGSAHVLAASSVDLTVKGLITPSACTPTLSNGGAVDYGKISAKDLKVDQQTFLDSQTVQFTVTCDAATLMAMEAKDNREVVDIAQLNAELKSTVARIDQLRRDIDAIVAEIEGEELEA